jgi:hypothetical protein
MLGFEADFFMPFLVFSVPIIAIVGGITVAVVKSIGQQRALELAARERIAAIERGIDPAKLPPMPWGDPEEVGGLRSPHNWSLRLLVGGIIVLSSGIGITGFLYFITGGPSGNPVWAVGLVPTLVGIGLLISAWVVRASAPANGGGTTG